MSNQASRQRKGEGSLLTLDNTMVGLGEVFRLSGCNIWAEIRDLLDFSGISSTDLDNSQDWRLHSSDCQSEQMATHEHTINDALAELLRRTRCAWQVPDVVTSENTGRLRGSKKRPDILIAEHFVSPVVIENEVAPATTVELDARSRLGSQLASTGRDILSSIAVRVPVTLRNLQGSALQDALRKTDQIEMALYTGRGPSAYTRMPESGWLSGGVHDLSILAQHASVPPDVIDQAATVLMNGIRSAAAMLGEVAASHPNVLREIGVRLRQRDGGQTRSMAMAILANALVFHEGLAGGPGELGAVRSLAVLRGSQTGLSQPAVLAEWKKILDVNYWPIFYIACRILEVMPSAVARDVLKVLAETADRLTENRLMRSHDLTGAVFQRLIADRRFLAAYYTTPAAAALLAGLAISPAMLPTGLSWSSVDDLAKLRIGDLACGTGTLVSIAYQRIGQLHEIAGGDAKSLHPVMMGGGLVGCDVLPAASHLTASMLAGAHPTQTYERSTIYTVAYGKQPDGRVALGSIDLLNEQAQLESFAITSQSADPTGPSDVSAPVKIPHRSFHLIIMNPPFTRPTSQEGERVGVPNPMFAAFGSSGEEQRRMGEAMKVRTKGTCYHGNAGEAAAFLALGNRKLKSGGVMALVMPLGLVAGDSWEASRKLIANGYEDIVIVSIASPKDGTVAFSSDTRTADSLIVGRKGDEIGTKRLRRAVFVMLAKRPAYPLVGAEVARQIRLLIERGKIRSLEEGPVGGTPIRFGDTTIGHAIDAPLPQSGSWRLSRITDLSLAQAAHQIATHGRFWLPGMSESLATTAPMSTVGGIGGKIGPLDRDIRAHSGSIRGPFDIETASPDTASTYPVLWGHAADRERTMAFGADCAGHPIKGKNKEENAALSKKVASVWAAASHCHINVSAPRIT
jgi:hypothetical protein